MNDREELLLRALLEIINIEPLPQAIADIAVKAVQAVCAGRGDEHAQAATLSPIIGTGQGR